MSDLEYVFWIGISLVGILWAISDETRYKEKDNGK